MSALQHEVAQLAQPPSAERVRALQRMLPRAPVQDARRAAGQHQRRGPRLPKWFMVWFVIALAWFCTDRYVQVYKWLQRWRRRGTPGRSTLCAARQRLGIAPLRLLADRVVGLQATPSLPGACYHQLRLMALDSFVLDVADTPANDRVFGRPGSQRSPAAFPQVRVLALCPGETATAFFDAARQRPAGRVRRPAQVVASGLRAAHGVPRWPISTATDGSRSLPTTSTTAPTFSPTGFLDGTTSNSD